MQNMSRFLLSVWVLATLISLTVSQNDMLRVRRSKPLSRPIRRATKGVENPFEMPEDSNDEPEEGKPQQVCPVYARSLSDSFDLIRAINNFRITHSLSAINISRSLMSTACAHMRDITASEESINNDCGLHSWSSCCYPSDHSNPNCMHRKALQVTTALKWNIYNVAAYELAYEWAGGPFSAIRALDMFVANPDHKKFLLQEDTWSDFKWRAIGASVGDRYAYIWFGTLMDPNGDFDQFNVESHVMELPGCACTGAPVTWRPTPTLSPEQKAEVERKKKLETIPSLYATEAGQDEALLAQLMNSTSPPAETKGANAEESPAPTSSSSNVTESTVVAASSETSEPSAQNVVATEAPSSVTAVDSNNPLPTAAPELENKMPNAANNSSEAPSVIVQDSKPDDGVKQVSISLSDFLKGLTQG